MSVWSARDAAWKRVRAQVLRAATHCEICGRELDFGAPARSRWSPSVDHVLPLSKLRGLDARARRRVSLDPANLRPVHFGCNRSRGDRRVSRPVQRRSAVW